MSQFDGDYAGIMPAEEEPSDADIMALELELSELSDEDRLVSFDPEGYEISSDGINDFNSYDRNGDKYDNEYDDEDDYDN